MKINKIFFAIIFIVVSSCQIKKEPVISLKMASNLDNNKGNLIALHVVLDSASPNTSTSNRGNYYNKRCEAETVVAFTYSVPIKAPKQRKFIDHPEFQVEKNYRAKGRFKLNKEDVYIINNGKKIFPNKLFRGEFNLNEIESNDPAYVNYNKHSTKFASFPIPCSSLLLVNSKLIISKIHKDDKIIKQNVEFNFIISDENQAYKIWLE